MKKRLQKYRELVMSFISFIFVFFISATYFFVWIKDYNSLYQPSGSMTHIPMYSIRGCLLLLAVYLVLVFLFSKIYNGFRLGTLRIYEIIISQTLSMVFINAITYFQICLMVREVVPVMPLLWKMSADCVFLLLWSLIGNRIYSELYPPKRLVMVMGSPQAGPVIEKLGRRYDRFCITACVPWQTGLQNIGKLIDENDGVILCDVGNDIKNDILKMCFCKSKRVYITPKLSDIMIRGAEHIHLIDTPLLVCRNNGLSYDAKLVKRVFDFCASLLGIIITSPLMLLTALCIKLSDHGPVLYSQDRLTRDGKVFKVYKFRSMIVDAESDGKARLAGSNDSRITPVGRLIRKVRIDELPQLFNILKGDMSFVGPRPERPELAAEIERTMPEFRYRLKVKAGLTGYAQVFGKYNTTPYDKLRLDLMYIENYSFLLDLKLILMTIKTLFQPESTEGVEEDTIKL